MTVSVDNGSALWPATFAAPPSDQLSPGTFQGAVRAPFNGSANGLSVSGAGRGCNQVKGSFDISAFSADSHGQMRVLDATFTQFCDSSPGALRGRVRYAAPADAPIVLTSANPVSVEGQPVVLSATVLPGTAPRGRGAPRLGRPRQRHFHGHVVAGGPPYAYRHRPVRRRRHPRALDLGAGHHPGELTVG
ncbi:MAG: hypothetical protein ABJA89_04960 [Lapillicoccus sp.]